MVSVLDASYFWISLGDKAFVLAGILTLVLLGSLCYLFTHDSAPSDRYDQTCMKPGGKK